jgi:hypothetical protein
MADKTEIVNLALTSIGGPPIADIEDDSPQAVVARTIYNACRDFVLEDFPWAFARKRVAVQKSTTAPVFEYQYKYDLPADYLRMLKVYPSYGLDEFMQTIGFGGGYVGYVAYYGMYLQYLRSKGYIIEGKYLFTNKDNTNDDVFILYTARVEDEGQWTPHFGFALSYLLAARMAPRIKQSTEDVAVAMNLYEAAKLRAWQVDHSSNYVEGEKGNEDWAMAGRSFMRGWRITY